MKKFTTLMLSAALFAFAASGFAQTLTTYIDNDANYGEGWVNGSNGNQDAFGAWTITETVAGGAGEGWIGEGIWPLDKTDFGVPPFSETGNAFCLLGKGDGHSVTAVRSFRKPLDVGESFSLMMAVAYDCGYDTNSLKGFVVLSGTDEIVKVNHDAFPGPISVNGFNGGLSSLTNYGTTPMTWTFTQTDANTLKVEGTPRDSTQDNFVTNIACAAGSIDGFRLQSANQINEDEDKRQTYFNNFTLVQDLSGLQTATVHLAEDSGAWKVLTPEATNFNFTVSIDDPLPADLQVNVSVAGSFGTPSVRSVTIPAGQLSATFSVECTVNRSGNYANVVVEGGGSSDNWGIYGPSFVLTQDEQGQYFTVTRAEGSRWTDPWDLDAGDVVTFYINNNKESFLDSNPYLAAVTDNGDVLPVTADISTNWTVVYNDDEDHTFNTAWTYGQLTAGEVGTDARVHFQVKFGDAVFYFDNEEGGYGFNVYAPAAPVKPIVISGDESLKAGKSGTYTVTFTGLAESRVNISIDGNATVSPSSYTISASSESTELVVTAGDSAGTVTLKVASADYPDETFATFPIAIVVGPDYSGYVAYDDASLYENGFDFAAIGEGTDKFGAWQKLADNPNNDALVVTSAPDASVLVDGKAFAIYANGQDHAEIQLLRPFVNPLAPGQTFSVVLSPNWRDGYKGVRLMGQYEGQWYQRMKFQYFNDEGDGGYVYRLDTYGDNEEETPSTSLGWTYSTEAITITLARADDGTYRLSFSRGGESVIVDIPYFLGTVDGVMFCSYEGGDREENNLVFNKLAIQGSGSGGETVVIPAVSFSGNTGTFTLPEGCTGISKVEVATEVENNEWKFDGTTTFSVEGTTVTIDIPDLEKAVLRITFIK